MHYHQHHPIVITPEEIFPNEARALFALVENGAQIIHLRHPGATENALCDLLITIHPEVLYHLTIHYHPHLAGVFGLGGVHYRPEEIAREGGGSRKSASAHDWMTVKSCMGHADYLFLSPIFDSVSKAGYKAAFAEEQLRVLLEDTDRPPVVALGGITVANIGSARRWGFEGAAAIGSIWETRNGKIEIGRTVERYKKLVEAWNGTKS
ncbi:MAG: thiamine phosphate synthase [Rikenellaceae bacterium]|jgi:thiamine-phosphate pyrophosphorylase|nr:thiamine phosphate synthase [Rikenellaceae bacterium]